MTRKTILTGYILKGKIIVKYCCGDCRHCKLMVCVKK
jgi:hypothetical protein